MSHRDLKSLAGILAIRDEIEPTILGVRPLISTFRGWAVFFSCVVLLRAIMVSIEPCVV